jgi:hypothetical protein
MNKKLTKTEIKTEIAIIKNGLEADQTQHMNTVITNEVYDETIEEFVPLTKSARIIAIQAMNDSEYLLRRIYQLLQKI